MPTAPSAGTDTPRCVWEAGALLGEGPLWCPLNSVLYWIDIKGRAIHRYRPGDGVRETIKTPDEIGCIVLREGGGMIAAFRSGISFFNPESGLREMIVDPESHLPGNRFNDGKCDRRGRLWVGSMDDGAKRATGSLYRLSSDMKIKKMLGGIVVANGLGWSPDDKTMYFTDSENRLIFAFDYDIESGEAVNQRVFAEIPGDAGVPDGMTVDALGYVWSAHWDGWRVTRYDPSGAVERIIRMPVPRPTSCMFGGEGLDRLYVTSASIGLTDRQLAESPLSGGLFEIDPGAGIKGLPEPRALSGQIESSALRIGEAIRQARREKRCKSIG